MNLLRKINKFILFILLSLFYAQAHASCNEIDYVFTIPDLNFNLNNIPLQGKIGNEIISPEQSITCTERWDIANRYIYDPGNKSSQILGRAIYPTSVPGIGYAVGLEPTNFCTTTTYWVKFQTCMVAGSQLTLKFKIHLQLFRIGTISNANNITIFRNNFLLVELYSNDTGGGYANIYQSSIPFNMKVNTCSVQSSSIINVNLPTISANVFPNVNSVYGRVPFSLTVNCANTTNLNITFTDNNNIGQTTSILRPSSTSTAKGIGVQLQYNGNNISFGPDSAEPGTTNQIVLNNNLTGIQTFPFAASYVRTGTVTPGTFSAKATFTLSYQ